MTPQAFIARCEAGGVLLYRNGSDAIKLRAAVEGATIPAAVKANVAKYKADLLPLLHPVPKRARRKPDAVDVVNVVNIVDVPDPASIAQGAAADAATWAVFAYAMRTLIADADAGALPTQAAYTVGPGTTVDDLNVYVRGALDGLRALRDARDGFARQAQIDGYDSTPSMFVLRLQRARIEWQILGDMAFWWKAEKAVPAQKGENEWTK